MSRRLAPFTRRIPVSSLDNQRSSCRGHKRVLRLITWLVKMRVLVIGGTGFIGARVVGQLAEHGFAVAVFHRGVTRAALPDSVRNIIDLQSVMPIKNFPKEAFEFEPDVVILTITMRSVDASAAVGAFTGRAGRIVLLSSGDVYLAYGRFSGI